jgi:beta-barrel assembly-enhancing protease
MNELDAQNQLQIELKKITSTKKGRRYFLKSLPFLLAGCSTTPKHADRHREGDNTGQETRLTYEDEKRMTEEYLPQMKKEYPPHRDAQVQRYIENLGQKVVRANGLHKNPYEYNFTVCDVKNVNAFALPAGTVFVTAPLIAMSESEAELAGVVGHEIGHIQARHTAERMEIAERERGKSLLYGLGGAVLGGAAGVGLSRMFCSREDRECMRRIALYGAAAGAGGGLLIQKFGFMANSREDEMEADRIGFRTSLQAGYDKDHIGRFYNRLLEMERQYQQNQNSLLAPLTDAMSTHPPSRERVLQMEQMAREASSPKGKVTSSEFERIRGILS